jgi:membrane protease YdiL (CAAX protease family)
LNDVQLEPFEKLEDPFRRAWSAFWRLANQFFVWLCLYLVIGIPYSISSTNWGDDNSLLFLREITKLITFVISVFIVIKVMDGRKPVSIGLKLNKRAIYDFLAGILITFVVLGGQFLLFLGAGWIQIVKFAWQNESLLVVIGNILLAFLIFTFTGVSEEILSRGFHLQTIEKGSNKFWGILLSSLIFAYLHYYNPGITWLNLILIFFLGLVMAYACLITNQLWLSIGLHTGWDFFVVSIFFGVPIGGLKPFHLFDIVKTGGMGIVFFILLQSSHLCF